MMGIWCEIWRGMFVNPPPTWESTMRPPLPRDEAEAKAASNLASYDYHCRLKRFARDGFLR